MRPDSKELLETRTGARIATVMPDLEVEIAKMLNVVINHARTDLHAGNLTPDRALQYWYEYDSTASLLTRMKHQVKIGQSSGEVIAPILNGTPDGQG